MESGVNIRPRATVVDMASMEMDVHVNKAVSTKETHFLSKELQVAGKYSMPLEDRQEEDLMDTCLGDQAVHQNAETPMVKQTDLGASGSKPEPLPVREKVNANSMQVPDMDSMACSEGPEIIDIGSGKKKVVAESCLANDEICPEEEIPGVKRKKRPMTPEDDNRRSSFSIQDLKIVDDYITEIDEGKTVAPQEIIFNETKFSGLDSLIKNKDCQENRGSFGAVLVGRDARTGTKLVWKTVKKVEKNEVLIPLQFSDHNCLARVYGFMWDGEMARIVMEDAGVSLRQLVRTEDLRYVLEGPKRIEKIALDVFKGIRLLARHGITHCDIKPENICVNLETMKAKLIDLGSCKTSQEQMTFNGITPEYLPPAFNHFIYCSKVKKIPGLRVPRLGEKDDVWGAGLVVLYVIIGHHPMIQWGTGSPDYGGTAEEIMKMRFGVIYKISQLCDQPCSGNPSKIPVKDVVMELLSARPSTIETSALRELLDMVLVVDEEKRPTSADVVAFLQKSLDKYPQPPRKAGRFREPGMATVPREEFVNLNNAKYGQPQSSSTFQESDSPPLDRYQSAGQPLGGVLGVVLKQKPASQQTGDILFPAKFFKRAVQEWGEQLQQNYLAPAEQAPPYKYAFPLPMRPPLTSNLQQECPAQKSPRQRQPMTDEDGFHGAFCVEAVDNPDDYQGLLDFFTNPSQHARPHPIVPDQRHAEFQASAAGFEVPFSNMVHHNIDIHQYPVQERNGPSQEGDDIPTAYGSRLAVSDQGLGDAGVMILSRQHMSQEHLRHWNMPNIEALMATTAEAEGGGGSSDNRPKLRGHRRLRSKDN